MAKGVKYDGEKPRWDLLPFDAVEEVVKVLTAGANKYADDNWKHVRPFSRRYISALLRHLVARIKGEIYDPETGFRHTAHMGCCALFLIWGDMNLNLIKEEQDEQ